LGLILKNKEVFGIKNGLNMDYWQVKKPKDEAKRDLIRTIKERTGEELDEKKLTIVIPRRITSQKGFDILIKLLRDIVKERTRGGLGAQVVLLGRAHENDVVGKEWVKEFERLNEELKNGFVFIEGFDLELAKIMYWGGDLGFYPSVPDKEPCGTGYMVALVNQAPTIATDTGGVVDTIEEFDVKTMKGNGFKISKQNYSSQSFWVKLKTASEIYYKHPEKWKRLMENCLNTDVSMKKVAKEYVLKLYKPALETKIK
jgi:starch synthase